MDEFDRSLQHLGVSEGGYSNHPKDPGGATMKGVTQRNFTAWLTRKGQPNRDVRTITDAECSEIYRSQYWDLAKCGYLPAGVSYVVFDGAVNSGVSQSVKWLQKALGQKVDGVIGDKTLSAATDYPDDDKLIALICQYRLAFMKSLTTWSTFKNGWTTRVKNVQATGQAWASGSVGPEPTFVPDGQAKALIVDAKSPPPKALGDASGGGGVVGGVISQSINALTPVTSIPHVSDILAYLTLASGIIAVAGFGYSAYAKHKRAALAEALDLTTTENSQPEATQVPPAAPSSGADQALAPAIPVVDAVAPPQATP